MNRTIGAACLAVAVLLAGCGGGRRAIRLSGSTSIQPFAQAVAEAYEAKHPEFRVGVQAVGSTAGLQAVSNGLADIGMCSRTLSEEEAKEFTPIVVARDGLAIIVHPSNPVKGLTIEQVRRIFAGRVENWKDVGGNDLPVRYISREDGSGTRESFVHLVMGKDAISRSALVQPTNGAVRERVRTDAGAVGYMSLGLVNAEVRALDVDGVAPTAKAVIEGRYLLARPFLFVVKDKPAPDAQALIDFALSDEGQAIFEKKGLVRAK